MNGIVKPVAVALLLLAMVGVAACGGEPRLPPLPTWVPVASVPWARVSREQIDAARQLGVPVAFENRWGMRFVLIPPGSFQMGSPQDEPGRREDELQHDVHLQVGFYLQVEVVSHDAYELTAPGKGGIENPWQSALHGAQLSRGEAEYLAAWLAKNDPSRAYRLPTEAEWEYACRAGSTTAYYWGSRSPDDWGRVTAEDMEPYRTNAWGLRDMLDGMFPEWCSDRYGQYPSSAVVDPTGPPSGERYALRNRHWAASGHARCARRTVRDGSGCARIRLAVPLARAQGDRDSDPRDAKPGNSTR